MVNFNLTATLSWTSMSILINTALAKIPIKCDTCVCFPRQVLEVSKNGSCAKGLCFGWGSVARGDRHRFCPGLPDGGCGTALRSRRQQVGIQHGAIIKVSNLQAQHSHSWTPLQTSPHLSPPLPPPVSDAPAHAVCCQEFIQFISFFLGNVSWSMWLQFTAK